MKFFWKYLFPVLFGLLIYTSIRLVTDTPGDEQIWHRPLRQNFLELFFCVFMSYLFDALMRAVLVRFQKQTQTFSLRLVVREFVTMLTLCVLLINPVVLLIHYLAHDPVSLADITIANIIVALYILLYYAIARGNSMLRSYVAQQVQLERLKNDQLQTELKLLKAQYHPHFLFNALNTIYFQMDRSVPDAKRTVEQFADLLRYQLYDQYQPVPVKQELEHLNNFIQLQKQRSTDRLQLSLCFDESLQNEKVYPLLFLPLVENAFKYVGGDYRLAIEARKEKDRLLFSVQNSTANTLTRKNEGGLGLENLKRRLELLYPGKHCFTAAAEGNVFKATIVLQTA